MQQGTRIMASELEIWGGPECTVNRVGDAWGDQSHRSGHHDRDDDVRLFAELGFKAVRYPVLWERVAPDAPDVCDWSWTDRRLGALRELGVRPIAGLVHHGSGPHYTSLLDPEFPAKLGDYAARAAERYPWVDEWTPVNEPLTTARFSAAYGHWYPHARDEGSFWTTLVNQVDGVRHAMRAVRRVNPAARVIQTDDLGRTYATAPVLHQAAFDNLRRWAGWDLLFGRITPEHPLWARLAAFGLADRLDSLADDPCPPDVIGVNHYLTSDRFLDHRLQRYPASTHGGNGHQTYADVEAIRVLEPAPAGLAGVLREAWDRYRTPVAVTEVHLGCTREEQLRWVADAWDSARALRDEGVDVRAITAWALMGSCGWNTLLTSEGLYEPGVFDISGGSPRPTALAAIWKGLPEDARRHPVARTPGWWRRPMRLLHSPVPRPARFERAQPALAAPGDVPPLLICGASGTLGRALARACDVRDIRYVATDRATLDVTDEASIARALDAHRPWAVVNATGWVRVDDAEAEPEACRAVNATGAVALARLAAERNVPTLNFSSDLVFDGRLDRPHLESDLPAPLSAYGRSKAEMERGLAELPGAHLVVRAAAFFGPDAPDFAHAVVESLAAGRPFAAAEDQIVTPTHIPDLVDAALDLLIDGADGVWHLTHGEAMSWAEFARAVARASGLDASLVRGVPGATLDQPAPRPVFAALGTEKGGRLRSFDQALGRFAAERSAGADAHHLRAA
jgi:dTDP-4-dehydrorhamnose reductase